MNISHLCLAALGVALFIAEPARADGAAGGPAASTTNAPPPLYVGLRRSSYGLRRQNADDAWWSACAKDFAAQFPGSQPCILHILSNYQDDGTTQIEFKAPDNYHGSVSNMSFLPRGKLNHERVLSNYDAEGVKVILQFEPGSANVDDCFELAQTAFGRHSCVAGLAIDGEWFRTRESADQTGIPISDADARRWMEHVLRLNPNYILVLKHFEIKHLPFTYRHPRLWLLTDSQEFNSQEEWMKDMREWQAAFKSSPIGSQFGYPKDQKWWTKSAWPPVDLGRALLNEEPDFRMLLWVDFTANRVRFGAR